MTFVISDETLALAKHGRIWRVSHSWTLGAAEPFHFGFVVGERDMIALSREYFTGSTGLRVELFQASFTGGAQAKLSIAVFRSTPQILPFSSCRE